MKDWLLLLIINELAILGGNKTTHPGMLMEDVAAWGRKHLPDWIVMPLYDCPYCMSSIWGTAVFWAWYHDYFSPGICVAWIVHVLALCGLAYLVLDVAQKKD